MLKLYLWKNSFLFILLFVPFICGADKVEQILGGGVSESRFSPFVTIAIAENIKGFSLEVDGEIYDSEEKKSSIQGNYKVAFGKGKGIDIGGKLFESSVLTIRSKFSFIMFDEKMFRGDIVVHRLKEGFTVVNKLHIEDYVRGVINSEILAGWPFETKKAQAVLARTYAVHAKMFSSKYKLYTLAPSVLDQVYSGFKKEDMEANKAVDKTRGEVLTWNNRPATIYFHSTCGGSTASSEEVWGKKIPYLKSVSCKHCKKSSLYRWRRVISNRKLRTDLKKSGFLKGKIRSISVKRGKTRVKSVMVNGSREVPVNRFRAAVGFSVIWSNDFSVKKRSNSWEFRGKGAGHGVGACQWGMASLAEKGKKYAEIVEYYFPGTKLKKMY